MSQAPSDLIHNQAGNYRIALGGPAFCRGVIPDPGFEIVRVHLRPWVPMAQAYAFVETHLQGAGRPVQALCGMELRAPAQLSLDGWSAFNAPYLDQVRKWGLMVGDRSGVCRSNIAIALQPPPATSLCAFSYTVPTSARIATFCLSGVADVDDSGRIIAEGELGPEAMRRRTRFTIDAVSSTLARLGRTWADTTEIAIFHVADIPDLFGDALLGTVGEAIARGVVVLRARPPGAGAEVELEARAVRQQLVVATG
jgi:hypothetical protein